MVVIEEVIDLFLWRTDRKRDKPEARRFRNAHFQPDVTCILSGGAVQNAGSSSKCRVFLVFPLECGRPDFFLFLTSRRTFPLSLMIFGDVL